LSIALGFDVGGSTIRGGLVASSDDGFEVLDAISRPLTAESKSPEAVAKAIAETARTLVAKSPAPVTHLGLGIAAQLTRDARVALNAPNLGWRDVQIAGLIEVALPELDVRIANDLDAILTGEVAAGAGQGCRDVVAIYPGTGVGGSVMVSGEIVRGARGVAGEIGHAKVGSGLSCGCGDTGCLETIAGGAFIERTWFERHGDKLRPDEIDARYRAGHPTAVTLWHEVGEVLARAASTAVAFLNPELVLFGGGVMERAPGLFEWLQSEIPARSPGVAAEGLRVEMGALGASAGIIGAAALR